MNTSSGWELFTGHKRNRSNEKIATVYSNGYLALTAATKELLGSDFAELVISDDHSVFGLCAADEFNHNAFRLRYSESNNRWLLNLNPFIAFYKLESLKGQVLNATLQDRVLALRPQDM